MNNDRKWILVTGADRGLGFAVTARFLEEGYGVYAGQFMPEWPQLSELKKSCPETLRLVPLDISSEASIAHLGSTLAKDCVRLDIVVNNAGILYTGDDIAGDWKAEDMMRQFRINTLGALRVTKQLLPLMEGGMKRLCFVSSEAGSIGNAHRTDLFGYCMSKCALNMGIRMLHNELYELGYSFRIYHPGWMKSYMSGEEKMQGKLEPEESARAAVRQFTESRSCEQILKMQDVDGGIWAF